ncbi:MAG: amidophosphoribosyltransferase [Candidatus Methanomethylicia archaeon]
MDEIGHNCGISGVFNFDGNEILEYLYWSLVALNHRGHHSYGIVTCDDNFHVFKGLGLVSDLPIDKLSSTSDRLSGYVGIGHVRYATSGESQKQGLSLDIQPVIVGDDPKVAIAYNGNITNVKFLRKHLVGLGYYFKGSSDAEVLALLLMHGLKVFGNVENAVKNVMEMVDGAYSVVGLLSDGEIFFFRDPYGLRPLVYGFNDDGNLLMVASESVALNINGLRDFRMVKPGELHIYSKGFNKSLKLVKGFGEHLCSFEFAYFARPDSKFDEKYVCEIRQELGRKLAFRYRDVAAKIDGVIPVPQTALDAAYGFHEAAGKPIYQWIIRDRYVKQRAFILSPEDRSLILQRKYNILYDRLRGKKIGLIDDSIVRGDTLKRLVSTLREFGVSEVHVFITFPMIIGPCFYGIDMATFNELAAFNRGIEDICRFIGANTINYQTIEDFVSAVSTSNLCLGCLTLNYPTPYGKKLANLARELAIKGIKFDGRITETLDENNLFI